ncbi:iron ABC transporter permease [Chryseolinea sp. H1M3-3]|uniref:iron ABC transporter permease n=1 Tax=Chryseolinea sp. H1M3-3 TaxID=3034144 RepID=UPI0023EDEAEC|nr:iron ABC transporter permease [Chryseolinea sp. H1M3-3]
MKLTRYMHWAALSGLMLLLFILNLGLGSVSIPVSDILNILAGNEASNIIYADIIWNFRITKALTCVLAGSALSIGGLQMQTLFRNALAGPDVLGLSSGASLAVSLLLMGQAAGIRFFSDPNPWTIVIASSIGAGAVFLIVLFIARRLGDNTSLLIIGLMMGAATASLVSVLQFLSEAEDQQAYLLWTFGSLGSLSWSEIQILTLVLVLGALVGLLSVKALNAWLLGDNYARSLGVNVNRSRLFIILSTSILTGGVTAFCGPIAFVGLAVPHLTKLIIKTHNHRVLLPAVMLSGAILMLFCDIIAQLPGSKYVLPINAITALIGAPVVIWIVLKSKRISI